MLIKRMLIQVSQTVVCECVVWVSKWDLVDVEKFYCDSKAIDSQGIGALHSQLINSNQKNEAKGGILQTIGSY